MDTGAGFEVGVEAIKKFLGEVLALRGPAVEAWVAKHQPTVMVLAAAKVGVIQANSSYPLDFTLEPQDPNSCDRNGLELLGAAAVVFG